MEINEEKLREVFDHSTIKKGYDYYQKDMVLSCEAVEKTKDHIVLKSEVIGSGRKFYDQHIKLTKRSGYLEIIGACTCPVRFNCKHIFASCLYYIKNIPDKGINNNIDDWIEKVIKLSTKPKIVSDFVKSEYFLIYRVFNDKRSYYTEDIKFYKAKILKNGKLSKGTSIKSENLLYGYSYNDILNSDDEEILSFAKGIIPNGYSHNSQELKGELGGILLKKMVKTNRCFYFNDETPLTLSTEIKHIDLKWEDIDNESSRLSLNIDENYRFLDTVPLMAIDTDNATLYEFKDNIKGSLISLLNNSPVIPKSELNSVYEMLLPIVGDEILPLPKEYSVKTIDTKPIAVLNLYGITKEDHRFHTMHLDFAYGEYLLSYAPQKETTSFLENGEKIDILRDLKFENEAVRYLEELGFSKEIENSVLYFLSLAEPNMQTALQRWSNFLEVQIPYLEERGWDIRIDESFTMKFEKNSNITMQSNYDDSNDWFGLSFLVEFNGTQKPLVDLISPLIEEFGVFDTLPDILNIEVEDNHFLEIEKGEVEPVLKTIFALFEKRQGDGKIKLSPFEAHLIEDMDENIKFKGSAELIELSKKLKDFKGLVNIEAPKGLNATLREYQQEGLNWLNFLYEFRFGGILADDMGLGKTIQTLAHLLKLKEEDRLNNPSLIIMPTSLIANWKNEAKKFTPELKVLSLHGNDRFERFELIKEYDIVLSTYPLIVRDFETLIKEQFFYIILDEAQKIKNPNTKMAKSIKSLKSSYRLALSGTPVENHLGELWSIFSFLMPGFLDTLAFFKKNYQNPIEKENDSFKQELLNKRIKPFMIRRTKDEVADELPPKSEIIKYTQFESKQSKLYETIRVTMEKKVRDAIEKKGMERSHITILDALLKLRQVCCDPALLKMEEAGKIKESAKLELFLDLVDELLEEGRKILVFSQFTSMLSILEENIKKRDITYTKLTGSTKNREEVIDEFKSGNVDIFLISLKAGGVGLNLIEADTVIHYDPWWNPAVENQATDRAYRIGQTKAVFVYKLIVENSIEQKIVELQKKKQALQDGILGDKKDDKDIFRGEELLELLKG